MEILFRLQGTYPVKLSGGFIADVPAEAFELFWKRWVENLVRIAGKDIADTELIGTDKDGAIRDALGNPQAASQRSILPAGLRPARFHWYHKMP